MPSTPDPAPLPTTMPEDASGGPSVFANSAANLLGLVLANGMSALGGYVTAVVLGARGVGILAVVFGLIDFGRSLSNLTHNPSIMEVHRGKDVATVFGTSLVLKLAGTLLFFGIVFFSAPWLAETFHVPASALRLASLVLVLGVGYEIGSARFEAEDRYVVRNLLMASGPAVGLAAVIILVVSGQYTIHTSIFTTVLSVATMSVGFLLAWKGPWRLRFDPGTARFMLRYGSILVASTFLTQALIWTDTLILDVLRGPEEAGVYNVAFQLTFVMVTASIAIGVALVPAMSRLAGRGADTGLAYQRGTLLALLVAGLLAVVYVVLGKWLLGLYGEEFVRGYVPLLVLTVFGVAGALAVPAASVLTVHGKAGTLTVLSLVQAVLNIPLNLWLIGHFGITGAALATTLVFCVGTVVLWALVRHHTGALPLSRTVFREGAEFLRVQARRLRG